jgi:hypothetical protein
MGYTSPWARPPYPDPTKLPARPSNTGHLHNTELQVSIVTIHQIKTSSRSVGFASSHNHTGVYGQPVLQSLQRDMFTYGLVSLYWTR